MKFNLRSKTGWAAAIVLCFSILGFYSGPTIRAPWPDLPASSLINQSEAEARPVPVEKSHPHVIARRATLYSTLRDLNVSSPTIQKIVTAAKPVADLARLKAGTRFQLVRTAGPAADPDRIEFRFSAAEKLLVKNERGQWKAEKIEGKVEVRIMTFKGVVTSTLWASAFNAKMDPNLIIELSEIFAWQVDFAREMRVNSRWRLLVEQQLVENEVVGWGSILAAELENDGKTYNAVLHRVNGEDRGYYTADGQSLRRMFLKSPISFARISSRFQKKRFHPIEQVYRPHLGVDYAAPTGTPIRAVGDGVVTLAGWYGGGGKAIKVRHNSTYQTIYMHLSAFAKGIRPGAFVRQGQVIGHVGSTGLATGPHLHFEFLQGGKHVDPLGKDFPAAEPMPTEQLTRFQSEAAAMLAILPEWDSMRSAALSRPLGSVQKLAN